MSDKITFREMNTKTYPHACVLEVDNINHSLRIVLDELDQSDDSMIRPRFDDISISMEDAAADPRIAADAQAVYAALRRITLVKIQDFVDKHSPQPDEEIVIEEGENP